MKTVRPLSLARNDSSVQLFPLVTNVVTTRISYVVIPYDCYFVGYQFSMQGRSGATFKVTDFLLVAFITENPTAVFTRTFSTNTQILTHIKLGQPADNAYAINTPRPVHGHAFTQIKRSGFLAKDTVVSALQGGENPGGFVPLNGVRSSAIVTIFVDVIQ